MRFRPCVVFASIILGSFYVGSCEDNPSSPPPPSYCASAWECLSIRLENPTGQIQCPINEQALLDQNLFYSAYNFGGTPGPAASPNPNYNTTNHNILAVIQQTQRTVGLPDYVPPAFPIKVLVSAKGNLTGGPDNVDVAGPPTALTCQAALTSNPDQPSIPRVWYFLYSVVMACFEDDPTCIISMPPIANPTPTPEKALARCENNCSDANGNYCSVERVGVITAQRELSQFAKTIYGVPPPTKQNIVSILQLLAVPSSPAPQPVCDFRDMAIDDQNNVSATGNPCTFRLRLGDKHPPSWYAVRLNVPVDMMGKRNQNQGTIIWDQNATANARIFKSQNAAPESESITALKAEPGKLLFAGEKQFCALITWEQR
jgi:hypothetical protein